MIRLALSGTTEAVRDALAVRLRGATLQATPEPDAVAFLGSADLAAVSRLLAGGKHVLLADGSCPPVDVLDQLATSAGRARLAVVNPDAHLPSRQLVRQLLHAGKLGGPGLVRLHRWEPAGQPSALVRDLEMVLGLVGSPAHLVYAVENAPAGFVQVHLGFAGGATALLDHARLPAGDAYGSLSVIGSSGAAHADDHGNVQLLYRGGPPLAVRTGEGLAPLASLLQDFIDGVQAGRDFADTLAGWRSALRVSNAVRLSLTSRQAIPLEGP
jgi:hypothetical protein